MYSILRKHSLHPILVFKELVCVKETKFEVRCKKVFTKKMLIFCRHIVTSYFFLYL